jgi:hypothetical protein
LEVISWTNKTEEWGNFIWMRCERFIQNRE